MKKRATTIFTVLCIFPIQKMNAMHKLKEKKTIINYLINLNQNDKWHSKKYSKIDSILAFKTINLVKVFKQYFHHLKNVCGNTDCNRDTTNNLVSLFTKIILKNSIYLVWNIFNTVPRAMKGINFLCLLYLQSCGLCDVSYKSASSICA